MNTKVGFLILSQQIKISVWIKSRKRGFYPIFSMQLKIISKLFYNHMIIFPYESTFKIEESYRPLKI